MRESERKQEISWDSPSPLHLFPWELVDEDILGNPRFGGCEIGEVSMGFSFLLVCLGVCLSIW